MVVIMAVLVLVFALVFVFVPAFVLVLMVCVRMNTWRCDKVMVHEQGRTSGCLCDVCDACETVVSVRLLCL